MRTGLELDHVVELGEEEGVNLPECGLGVDIPALVRLWVFERAFGQAPADVHPVAAFEPERVGSADGNVERSLGLHEAGQESDRPVAITVTGAVEFVRQVGPGPNSTRGAVQPVAEG